jgi:phage-related holin
MKNWLLYFGFAGSASGAWFSEFIGRTNAEKQLLTAWVMLMALDWISGTVASYKKGMPISSARARAGMPKIVGYIVFVLLAFVVPVVLKAVGAPVPALPIPSAVLGWICFIEALSVLENVSALTSLNVGWLKRILEGAASSVDPSNKAPEVGAQDGTQ